MKQTNDDEIKKAFTNFLGTALEDMDEIERNLYSPDYELFKAGWEAGWRKLLGWVYETYKE